MFTKYFDKTIFIFLENLSCCQQGDALQLTARRYVLVSVTRRQHRHESVPIGQETVTVQGGYGVVFAIQVQSLMSITRVAVQV